MEEGVHYAGYGVVPQHAIIGAQSLPPGISAQLVELIALTQALQL